MSTTSSLIQFVLNDERVSAQVESYETILEVIRTRFALYGARESCGQGLCGCCTVRVNGEAVTGCLYPALYVDGTEVTTIENLDKGGELDPLQQAFIECGALQCGFCTPGFIMMSRQLLDRYPNPSEAEVRHYLAGNLCRCGTYPEIVRAVMLAAQREASKDLSGQTRDTDGTG